MKKLQRGFFSFWIENYKVSFLILFLIFAVGISSIFTIPKESSPDIKFGIISITTLYNGVNPQDIDALITDKIEAEIEDIEGISKLSSTSSVGLSNVVVELENGIETRDVMTDIKDRIDTLVLPSGAEDTLVREISTRNELLFEALIYAPKTDYNTFSLLQRARKIQSDLEGKGGIATINIGASGSDIFGGGATDNGDYEIEILLRKDKLQSLGLSLGAVRQAISAYNKNTPLGNFKIGDLNYDFRIDGEFTSMSELADVIVSGKATSVVTLSDIAEIRSVYPDLGEKSMGGVNYTGMNYVTLSVNKKVGDNVFTVSGSAKKQLEEYINSKTNFNGIEITYTQDLAQEIIKDYKSLGTTALQTLVLVFITIFIFVGFRESLIASILLPLAFCITFTVLQLLGLSLNFLTNFSLVLTLGIAIDTIIVIIEGASERQKLGYEKKSAAILAVQDLKSPLISGTMTTLVAFLPMMFLPGIVGRFLAYIPITVFITLLAALVLSLTMSSVLFYSFASRRKSYVSDKRHEFTMTTDELAYLQDERKGKREVEHGHAGLREKFLRGLGNLYYSTLRRFLKSLLSRILSVLIPIVLLFASFFLLSPQIGFTLFPNSDEGIINISAESSAGSDTEILAEYIPQIEKILSTYPEMKVFYISAKDNSMSVYIELIDEKERKRLGQRSVFDVEENILDQLSFLGSDGIKLEVATASNGPPAGAPVGIKLRAEQSSDVAKLSQVANEFKAYLQSIDGTKNVRVSSSENPGQFVFEFDRDRLSYSGISPDEILSELRPYMNGLTVGSMKSAHEDNDITLYIDEFRDAISPNQIENVILPTSAGEIRLGDYMSYSFEPSLSSIQREDRKINIGVQSDLQNGVLPSELQPKLLEFAKDYTYPDGISYIAGGEAEENSELIFATLQSFVIALFLIFAILVFQFNSFSQPLIILYSVVLALLGVNIGLFVTGNPYSMPFAIGFIALTGVVVNDAIILVDRINRNIARLRRNADKREISFDEYVESLVAAGKSRLQPIIVTTLTTIFGVLPLALQDPFWAGLGFTIIFGLFAGSFMTLFIIPALYYMTQLRKKIKR